MLRFEEVAKIVLGHEGGLVDDPLDRGGRTNLGITQSTLDNARRTIPGLPERVDDLTAPQALTIYRRFYWDVAQCGKMPEPVDFLVFDAAIHGGAGFQLQRALNQMGAGLREDGSIGPLTLAALDAALVQDFWRVVGSLQNQRVRWLFEIVRRDPTQKRFFEGWINRALKNAALVGL